MKRYLIGIALIFALSLNSYAQDVDQFLKNVSKTENIDRVKIGRFMMTLGKAIGGVSDMPVTRGVHSLEVYDLSCCNNNLRKDFARQINNLEDGNGYETLLMAKSKGDNVRIMIKKKKDIISDMVILCMDDNDPAIIKLSGKIKEKDIAELVNKYDK